MVKVGSVGSIESPRLRLSRSQRSMGFLGEAGGVIVVGWT